MQVRVQVFNSDVSTLPNIHCIPDQQSFNWIYVVFLQTHLRMRRYVLSLPTQRLVKRIQQATPLDQTSCFEGFHSVLNHFAPKMIA